MVTPEEIERYLKGDCTETESREIEDWYYSFEENPDYISGLDEEQQTELKSRLQYAIRSRIRLSEASGPVRKLRTSVILKIAASLVIAFGLGYLARENLASKPAPENLTQLIENTQQHLMRLTLPDTSTVWLYPGAIVEYQSFGNDTREIRLTGQAFFEITRDTLRPFLIHSTDFTTRVLGTSFQITARPEDSTASVLVKTGKVAVQVHTNGAAEKDNQVILTSTQKAVFSKARNRLVKETAVSRPELTLWTARSLSFQNAPLPEVAEILSAEFGIAVHIEGQGMDSCTIRADFTDQNLPTIIELICKSVAAEYEMLDDQIFIFGEGCGTLTNHNPPIKKETI